MYYIYILKSESAGSYYVGHTDDPVRRLAEHNHSVHLTFTSKYRPWIMVALFECSEDRRTAQKLENFIKHQKSKSFLEKMIHSEKFSGILAQLAKVPRA
ncbi:MAG: GIY-YIG nuclease family protein [Bacteroidales bacterium]|nr:GIY-YIG nuclease family protein [Bacteroidales bacterium]